ncbi:MAG TPA: DUF5683 domain-containing protein [Cyclobacteriaceae bacterium]|nr:DUF5683 domain-containing protein [Cyclobacteriaceae bacterium]
MKKIVLTLCLLSLVLCSVAQKKSRKRDAIADTAKYVPDTVALKSYATRYDPRKAIMYAAVLPGLGQVYNKKYWKLPLVYGGFIGFGYGISVYHEAYTKYKADLFDVLESTDPLPVSPDGLNEAQLRKQVDKMRRERDFMIILMAGMYLLQMVDAHVDAHLKEFDLNPNLHVRLQPTWESDMVMGQSVGFSVKLRF